VSVYLGFTDTNRSISIDDLTSRVGHDMKVLYFFFDYKSQETQTAVEVAMNLLKQLISGLDEIPDELEFLYNQNSSARPDLPTCIQLLNVCAAKFNSLYAVFDAMDECSDESQMEVFELIAHLQKLHCRILVSSRPHSLSTLRDELNDTQTLQILAEESDLKNYITATLSQKGKKVAEFPEEYQPLVKGADGM
jgi:hypothetical protein